MPTTAREVLKYTTEGIDDPAKMCIALEKAGEYAGCVGKKNADLKDVASRIQGIATELRGRLACDSKNSATLAGLMGSFLPSPPNLPNVAHIPGQPTNPPPLPPLPQRPTLFGRNPPTSEERIAAAKKLAEVDPSYNPFASAAAAALSKKNTGTKTSFTPLKPRDVITSVPTTSSSPLGGNSKPTPKPNQQPTTRPNLPEIVVPPPSINRPNPPATVESPPANTSNGFVAGVAKPEPRVLPPTNGNVELTNMSTSRGPSREGNIAAAAQAEKDRSILLKELDRIRRNIPGVSGKKQLAEDEKTLNKQTKTDDIKNEIDRIKGKYATQLAAPKNQSGGRRSRRNKGHNRRRVTRK
jgi:hypothetical protein